MSTCKLSQLFCWCSQGCSTVVGPWYFFFYQWPRGCYFPLHGRNLFDHDNTHPINRVREQEHLEACSKIRKLQIPNTNSILWQWPSSTSALQPRLSLKISIRKTFKCWKDLISPTLLLTAVRLRNTCRFLLIVLIPAALRLILPALLGHYHTFSVAVARRGAAWHGWDWLMVFLAPELSQSHNVRRRAKQLSWEPASAMARSHIPKKGIS